MLNLRMVITLSACLLGAPVYPQTEWIPVYPDGAAVGISPNIHGYLTGENVPVLPVPPGNLDFPVASYLEVDSETFQFRLDESLPSSFALDGVTIDFTSQTFTSADGIAIDPVTVSGYLDEAAPGFFDTSINEDLFERFGSLGQDDLDRLRHLLYLYNVAGPVVGPPDLPPSQPPVRVPVIVTNDLSCPDGTMLPLRCRFLPSQPGCSCPQSGEE